MYIDINHLIQQLSFCQVESIEKPDIQKFEALAKRYSLIPLKPKSKQPMEKNWQQWCEKKRSFNRDNFNNDRNAGIACGAASGILVVDVDDLHGFAHMCETEGWALPKTYTVMTGSGKPHFYYEYPLNGNRYGNKSIKKIFDIRGSGGVVVAPGSIHPDTGLPYTILNDLPVATAPDCFLDLFKEFPMPDSGQASEYPDLVEVEIDHLSISNRIYSLIKEGAPVGSRSEAIMSVVNDCVRAELSEGQIFWIFENYPIGEKYLEKRDLRYGWLLYHIHKANLYVGKAGRWFKLTDLGNAERLAVRHGRNLHYCSSMGKWLIWDGKKWNIDDSLAIVQMAKQTVRSIYNEAEKASDEDMRKKIAKHAHRSESRYKLNAMINLAQSEKGISIKPEELDSNPQLFNVQNGTINLRTGKLLPHRRADLITFQAPVQFNAEAEAPGWNEFLKKIMSGNKKLINYLQKIVGYSLTGHTSEHCIFFLYGSGANGKSTFVEVIRSLMGDYAKQSEFKTFLSKNDYIRNDIARLKGARFVSAVETNPNQRLDEALVKQITGGDTITARFLYHEPFEFRPTFKIFLVANHMPSIKGTEHAIWRRIRVIPFDVTISEEERDPKLLEKLQTELPGILNWAVEGCLEWQRDGLDPPQEVWSTTDKYRKEMDLLSGFLSEACIMNKTSKVQATELYDAYVAWCEKNNIEPVSQKMFGSSLGERGFKRQRQKTGYYWCGLALGQ